MILPSIDERTLRGAVTPADAVRAVREAFRADGEGRTAVPAVINLPDARHARRVPRQDGVGRRRAAHRRQGRIRILRQSGPGPADRFGPDGAVRRRDGHAARPAVRQRVPHRHPHGRGRAPWRPTAWRAATSRRSASSGRACRRGSRWRACARCGASRRLVAWSIDAPGLDAYCREMRDAYGLEAVAAARSRGGLPAGGRARHGDAVDRADGPRRVAAARPAHHRRSAPTRPASRNSTPPASAAPTASSSTGCRSARASASCRTRWRPGVMREADVWAQLGEVVAGSAAGPDRATIRSRSAT